MKNKTTGRPDLYGHVDESPSQVRRRLRRQSADKFSHTHPASKGRGYERKAPRRSQPVASSPRLMLEEVFYGKREHRFAHPAGRRARETIEGRGLKVHPSDIKAMAKHRKRSAL